MVTELHDLSIAQLSALIAARKLSPVELVDALIRRVEEFDGQTRAFITPTFELARRQARAAEAEIAGGKHRGPLHGIPFALKDIYDTRGILTSGHSRVFIDRIPDRDATATARLYDAGAVLLGKLATHEMAHAGPSFDLPWPPARNPWNLERFTGGSSSGSGAAVAAGIVPVALGSDTGGSIRIPASMCGVTGVKPTHGAVALDGVMPLAPSLDTVGPLAASVEDAAVVHAVLTGTRTPDLPGSVDGITVGVLGGLHVAFLQADVMEALMAAAEVFDHFGAGTRAVAGQGCFAPEVWDEVAWPELAEHHGSLLDRPELLHRRTAELIARGKDQPGE